jgi:hypothetical protein
MRIRAAVIAALLAVVAAACGGAGGNSFFRQYEYEEEIYLSLDGTATVYVNSSIPALNALRGTSFDTHPNARVDTEGVRAFFSSPGTHVTRLSSTRRDGRQFVHIRLDADNIRHLAAAPPFAWSVYDFRLDGNVYRYQQTVGHAAGKDVGNVGWNGQELLAFRLHLPSKITFHNTGGDVGRGNILTWEQPLADRLRSLPLRDVSGHALKGLEARMETQSILYRTLWLFGWTLVAAAAAFALVIWLIVRRG